MDGQQAYSDVPDGYKVLPPPGAPAQYSDVPQGYKVLPPAAAAPPLPTGQAQPAAPAATAAAPPAAKLPATPSVLAPQFAPGGEYKPPPPAALPPSMRLTAPAGPSLLSPQEAAELPPAPAVNHGTAPAYSDVPAGYKTLPPNAPAPPPPPAAPAVKHGMTPRPSYDTGPLEGQEVPGMLTQGNVDVNHRPSVTNADGSQSSIFSMTVPVNAKGEPQPWPENGEKNPAITGYALVPSIVDGKFLTADGRMPPYANVPDGELNPAQQEIKQRTLEGLEKRATDYYARTGQHLGIFDSAQAADDYAAHTHAYAPDGSGRRVFTPSYQQQGGPGAGMGTLEATPSAKPARTPLGVLKEGPVKAVFGPAWDLIRSVPTGEGGNVATIGDVLDDTTATLKSAGGNVAAKLGPMLPGAVHALDVLDQKLMAPANAAQLKARQAVAQELPPDLRARVLAAPLPPDPLRAAIDAYQAADPKELEKVTNRGLSVANVLRGVGGGARQVADGLSTPQNLAMIYALTESSVPRAVRMLTDMGFAATQAREAVRNLRLGYDAYKKGDTLTATEEWTSGLADSLFAFLTGSHLVGARRYEGPYGERGVRIGGGAVQAEAGYRPAYREPGPTGSYAEGEGSRVVPGSPTFRARLGPVRVGTRPPEATPAAPPPAELTAGTPAPAGAAAAVPPEGERPIGAVEPETGRPVLQQGTEPAAIQAAATAEHPEVKTALARTIASIPGARMAGARDEKDADRLEEKISEEGQSPQTARDYSGFRIAVDSPAAADAVARTLSQRFEVLADQDHFAEGDDEYGFHAHTLNVREPGSEVSHEVQILPREVASTVNRDHALYEQARQGDEQAATALRRRNAEHFEAFDERQNGGQHRYQFRSTQVDIPPGSEAAAALDQVRAAIPDQDLAGDGKDVGGNHVTVRYGLKHGVTRELRNFIESQAPFEATLGPTEAFPPSESSDGAAPVHARVEAPEFGRLNREIEQRAGFAPTHFDDYKAHATIAYVKPEAAEKYVGDQATEGKRFRVDAIAVTDRDGGQTVIPLRGGTHAGSERGAEALAVHGGRQAEAGGRGSEGVAGIEPGLEAAGAQPPLGNGGEAPPAQPLPRGLGEAPQERRVNPGQRKAVGEMSPEEMRRTLLTSDKTDLPNRRAFEEAERARPAAAVAMSDADGLKAFNDKFGYAAGDQLLRAKAAALTAVGLEAYHDKGDEFLYRGASEDALRAGLEQARQILRDREIEVTTRDGATRIYKGADFSYGTGRDLTAAEAAQKQHKAGRTAAGERARGELRGITEARPGPGAIDQGAAGEVAPGEVGSIPTSEIHFDPKRFQYKLDTDASGTTNLLKGQRWNPELAGVISVWRDPADGRIYVVNGHHRAQLAVDNRVPRLNVIMLPAATAAEARATGAIQNIADGRGTKIDAAKFFRDSGITLEDLREKGISLGEATAADGLALARLDQPLFDKVVNGQMRVGRAVAIGNATAVPAQQEAILKLIQRQEMRGKRVSDETVDELARMVNRSGEHAETQQTLFGQVEMRRNLALEKAEVSAYIREEIAKERRLFSTVADKRRAAALERGKNRINAAANAQTAAEAAEHQELYDRLSTRAGPVDDLLNEAAKALAEGKENPHEIKRRAYTAARAALAQAYQPGQAEGPPGAAVAPAAGQAAGRGAAPAGAPGAAAAGDRTGAGGPAHGLAKGDVVRLKDGRAGVVQYMTPAGVEPPRARVRLPDGTMAEAVKPADMTRVASPQVDPASPWIGVDLDKTLAQYSTFKGPESIGAPVPAMLARVKAWLAEGRDVRVLTARVSEDPGGKARAAIEAWLTQHLGRPLPVTDVKDDKMVQLWDDRAVQVEPNTGQPVAGEPPPEGEHAQDQVARAAPAGRPVAGNVPGTGGPAAVAPGAAQGPREEPQPAAAAAAAPAPAPIGDVATRDRLIAKGRFQRELAQAENRLTWENAAKAQVRTQSIHGAPVHILNAAAYEALRKIAFPEDRFAGVFLARQEASRLVTRIRAAESNLRVRPFMQAGANALKTLALALDQGREADGSLLLLRADYDEPTLLEELWHRWYTRQGLRGSDTMEEIAALPVFERAVAKLGELYPGMTGADVAAEIVGKALAGDPDIDWKGTEQADLAQMALEAAIDEKGPGVLDELPPVDPKLTAVVERAREYAEQARAGARPEVRGVGQPHGAPAPQGGGPQGLEPGAGEGTEPGDRGLQPGAQRGAPSRAELEAAGQRGLFARRPPRFVPPEAGAGADHYLKGDEIPRVAEAVRERLASEGFRVFPLKGGFGGSRYLDVFPWGENAPSSGLTLRFSTHPANIGGRYYSAEGRPYFENDVANYQQALARVIGKGIAPQPAAGRALAPDQETTRSGAAGILAHSPALPGMESLVREGEEARTQAEREAMEERMRTPLGSIERRAGEMERNAPLFEGTEANAQASLFGGPEDEGGQGGLFKREAEQNVPTWYLKSERVIADKMKGPMPGAQLVKMLENNGVKPEELKWTGLEELRARDRVTPEEVRQTLAANNLQLHEVLKGPTGGRARPATQMYEAYPRPGHADFAVGRIGSHEPDSDQLYPAREQAEDQAAWLNEQPYEMQPTLHGSWVEPGGKNYHELLLELPDPGRARYDALTRQLEEIAALPAAEHAARPGLRAEWDRIRNEILRRPQYPQFRTAHWPQEADVVGHVRFNDRTGPDGEALLHLEELQSDWHQRGRRKGYLDRTPTETDILMAKQEVHDAMPAANDALARNDDLGFDSRAQARGAVWDHEDWAERWEVPDAADREAIERWRAAMVRAEALGGFSSGAGAVPDAPFKKTWPELLLRRMVRYAAENGYAGVSWTPGPQQAARYNLSKFVSRVGYTKRTDGRFDVFAEDKNRQQVLAKDNVTKAELAEIIGKDLAEKIDRDTPGIYDRYQGNLTGEVTGLDLDLSAEGRGQKIFYDQIVPEVANKVGKPFGAKVGKTVIHTKPAPSDLTVEDAGGGLWAVVHAGDTVLDTPLAEFPTRAEAARYIRDLGGEKLEVPYLPVTEAMRESVMREGQPLFRRTPATTVTTGKYDTGKPLTQAIDELKDMPGRSMSITEHVEAAADAGVRGIADTATGLAKTWGAIRGAAVGAWQSWAQPAPWTDYFESLGDLRRAELRAALDVDRYQKELKRVAPTEREREAITVYGEAGGDPAVLRRWAVGAASTAFQEKPGGKRYARAFEDALGLSPQQREVAEAHQHYYDRQLRTLVDAGLLPAGASHYVMHTFATDPETLAQLRNVTDFAELELNPRFLKRRVWKNFFEAITEGENPRTMDAGKILSSYHDAFTKTFMTRSFLRSLLYGQDPEDGRPIAALEARNGWGIVDKNKPGETRILRQPRRPETVDDYRRIPASQLRNFTWELTDADRETLAPGYSAMSPEEQAKLFGPDDPRFPVPKGKELVLRGDILIHPRYAARVADLVLKSWFDTPSDHLPVRLLKGAARGVGKLGATAKSVILYGSGFHQVQLGMHALDHFISPFRLESLEELVKDPTVQDGVGHGLKLVDIDPEGVLSGLPGMGTYHRYLFRDYIPRLKAHSYLIIFSRNQHRFGARMTRDELAYLSAMQTNAAFSGLDPAFFRHLAVMNNRTWRAGEHLLLFSPDFTKARAQFVAQGFSRFGAEQALALLRGAAIMYAACRILNAALNHDQNWRKGAHWAPEDAFTIVTPQRWGPVWGKKAISIRTVYGDMARLIADPKEWSYNRLNPATVRPSIEFITGRDNLGRQESKEHFLRSYATQMVPIPAQKVFTTNDEGFVESFFTSLGANMANYHTPLERFAHNLRIRGIPDKPESEEREAEGRRIVELGQEFRDGRLTPAELWNLVNAGKLSARQAASVQERGSMSDLQYDVKHMDDFDDALAVWNKADPSERAEIRDIMEGKADRHVAELGQSNPPAAEQLTAQLKREGVPIDF